MTSSVRSTKTRPASSGDDLAGRPNQRFERPQSALCTVRNLARVLVMKQGLSPIGIFSSWSMVRWVTRGPTPFGTVSTKSNGRVGKSSAPLCGAERIVRTDRVPKALAQIYNDLFARRQEGDSVDFVRFETAQVEP